jgi:hypothetical protein
MPVYIINVVVERDIVVAVGRDGDPFCPKTELIKPLTYFP